MVTDEHLFRDSSYTFWANLGVFREMSPEGRPIPGVLLANRQIFDEALPLFRKHVTVGLPVFMPYAQYNHYPQSWDVA